MGKASRLKAEKRKAPPPVGKRQGVSQRTILFVTIGVIVVIVAGAIGYSQLKSSPSKPPPAAASAADKNAPASLVKAARRGRLPRRGPRPGSARSRASPRPRRAPPSNPNLLPVGSKAPAFTLKTPTGQTVSLSDYRGKATLLEFFATWCPHCDAEAPHVSKLFASLPRGKYALVSVNADGETAAERLRLPPLLRAQLPGAARPEHPARAASQSPGAAGQVTTAYQVQRSRPSTSSTRRARSPGPPTASSPTRCSSSSSRRRRVRKARAVPWIGARDPARSRRGSGSPRASRRSPTSRTSTLRSRPTTSCPTRSSRRSPTPSRSSRSSLGLYLLVGLWIRAGRDRRLRADGGLHRRPGAGVVPRARARLRLLRHDLAAEGRASHDPPRRRARPPEPRDGDLARAEALARRLLARPPGPLRDRRVVTRRGLAALCAAACVAAVAAPSALAHGGQQIATIRTGAYVARVDALLVRPCRPRGRSSTSPPTSATGARAPRSAAPTCASPRRRPTAGSGRCARSRPGTPTRCSSRSATRGSGGRSGSTP